MLRPQLSADFRFALMVVFGALTVLAITPFAIYRFANDQLLAGGADVLIQLCIVLIVWYAWRGGNMDRAGLLAAIATSAGCVAIGNIVGLAGVLWLYPVLVANFLLTARLPAAIVSLLAIGTLAATDVLGDVATAGSFVASALLVSLFAYIFGFRSDLQRRRLERLAGKDPLTGAFNRRGMERELELAIKVATSDGVPVGLAVLDLDHFKDINDRYGHEAGDSVLVQFASVVRALTRKHDRLFRTGGEEFALLVPEGDLETLRTIGEDLRRAVRRQVRCGAAMITVSIGATPLQSGDTIQSWLHRADQAMYQAKREGRDRVVVTPDPGLPPAPRESRAVAEEA